MTDDALKERRRQLTSFVQEHSAKGNDALYDSGINGLDGTGMIAKGGCMRCTDEEVVAAVDYMIAGSQ